VVFVGRYLFSVFAEGDRGEFSQMWNWDCMYVCVSGPLCVVRDVLDHFFTIGLARAS
jgi:hypothetical protein